VAIAMHPMTTRPGTRARRGPPRVHERSARRGRPDAACYRRRRAAVGLLLAVVVGGGAMVADGVLTGPGDVTASAAGAGTAHRGRGMVVRAAAGDSLWSIAEEHHGRAPLTRYVEALIDLNGGTLVVVGQLVQLP